jgi:hypothetical protein
MREKSRRTKRLVISVTPEFFCKVRSDALHAGCSMAEYMERLLIAVDKPAKSAKPITLQAATTAQIEQKLQEGL